VNLSNGSATMNANRQITVSGSGTYTIPALAEGSAGLSLTTVNGATGVPTGILALSSGNTYTGGTTINGGVVRFNSGAIPTTGTITIGINGALSATSSGAAHTTLASWLADTTPVDGLDGCPHPRRDRDEHGDRRPVGPRLRLAVDRFQRRQRGDVLRHDHPLRQHVLRRRRRRVDHLHQRQRLHGRRQVPGRRQRGRGHRHPHRRQRLRRRHHPQQRHPQLRQQRPRHRRHDYDGRQRHHPPVERHEPQDISTRLKINDGVTATLDTQANNVTFASPVQTGVAGTRRPD